jgi:hypothetical protein
MHACWQSAHALMRQRVTRLQGLEAAAAERVRSFLLERVATLRPGASGGASNVTIRRQGLLAFAAYPAFLRARAPAAYRAVLQRYCDDHRAHLAGTVRAYLAGLAAVMQRKERPTLVTAAELAGGGLNARLGSMFLPGARPACASDDILPALAQRITCFYLAGLFPVRRPRFACLCVQFRKALGALHVGTATATRERAGAAADDHLADFELGSRADELLHPDFSRWPAQALRASAHESRPLRIYHPIALQSVGKQKVPREAAFKAVLHQLCAAAAGEFAFLECAATFFAIGVVGVSKWRSQHCRQACHFMSL